jgi:hypothetical protein
MKSVEIFGVKNLAGRGLQPFWPDGVCNPVRHDITYFENSKILSILIQTTIHYSKSGLRCQALGKEAFKSTSFIYSVISTLTGQSRTQRPQPTHPWALNLSG